MATKFRINGSLYKENTKPRQLKGYLAFSGLDGALNRLADEVTTIRARMAFKTIVPENIDRETELLLFRDGELRLYTGESTIGSWLRNRQERILRGMKEAGTDTRRVRVFVSPHPPIGKKGPVEKPLPPTDNAVDVVRKSASMVEDKALGEALDRLANRLSKREKY